VTAIRLTRRLGLRALRRGAGLLAVAALAGCGAQAAAVDPTPSLDPTATATAAAATASPTASPAPSPTPISTFQPIDVWATPTPVPSEGALPTDQIEVPASRRPIPDQSAEWLAVKAAGRLALVDGQPTVLLPSADPLTMPRTGQPVPAARTLDTDYARWIIEPMGKGRDAMDQSYEDANFWNFCEVGASAVALYYWQQLNGYPDVTGTEGYFIDPYEAEGVAWPSPGPKLPTSEEGEMLGMYWSGEDDVNGYTAYARGYQAYLGMEMQPPGWKSTGMAVFAINGKAIYRTFGAPRTNVQVALNWEASGHDRKNWVNFWYTGVMRFEPTLARDLKMAVMLDVGRDGVPVIPVLDTYVLPNWQDGSKTRHVIHAVAIVGYDNTSNPPTYTYLDTCARLCNSRAGNRNGGIYTVPQDLMVQAIQDTVGSGFVW
jgi:hypothetical protein